LNIRRDNEKSFKIKKLFDELPTMEKLKTRKSKVYLENFNCPRCGIYKETLEHLWECSKADNDIVFLQLESREFIKNLIHKAECFVDIDNLLEKLFKYTKIKKNLQRHTSTNARFYKSFANNNSYKLEFTYIWDHSYSLDFLIKGWIPNDLVNTLSYHIKRKNKKNIIKSIITRWIGKINNIFFENIWKKRNKEMIEFEKQHNINIKDKKSTSLKSVGKQSSTSNKRNRCNNKRSVLNNSHKPPDIYTDDTWYDRIKHYMGFNKFYYDPFYNTEDTISDFWGVREFNLKGALFWFFYR
jgi:hypothetical protein